MLYEERLTSQRVGNLPHSLTRIKKRSRPLLELEEELSGRITNLLNFKLKREQEITVESMFMNEDVLVLLPTGKNSVNIINVDSKWRQRQTRDQAIPGSSPALATTWI